MMIQDFPEDETILSAYLDGELDFELRQVVESTLASDSQLADQLRRLVEVRDLIAGMGRPRPIDLSGEILGRIQHLQRARRRGRPTAAIVGLARSPWRMAGVGVVAASLLIGSISLLSRMHPSQPGANSPLNAPSVTPSAATSLVKAPESATLTDSSTAIGSRIDSKHRSTDVSAGAVQLASTPPISEDFAEGSDHTHRNHSTDARERVRRLLDSPDLRHVFLVADQIAGATSEKISELIEQSVRDDFFTITVAQGIVIDPNHPAQSKVFAFTIDESELEHFRARLNATIKVRNEEIDASPEFVTQLTEIGQVFAYSPPAVGEIVIPRSDVALKTKQPEKIPNSESVQIVAVPYSGSSVIDPSTHKLQPGSPRSDQPIEARKNPAVTRDAEDLVNHSNAQTPNQREAAANQRQSESAAPSREIVVLVWLSPPSPGSDRGAGPPSGPE